MILTVYNCIFNTHLKKKKKNGVRSLRKYFTNPITWSKHVQKCQTVHVETRCVPVLVKRNLYIYMVSAVSPKHSFDRRQYFQKQCSMSFLNNSVNVMLFVGFFSLNYGFLSLLWKDAEHLKPQFIWRERKLQSRHLSTSKTYFASFASFNEAALISVTADVKQQWYGLKVKC